MQVIGESLGVSRWWIGAQLRAALMALMSCAIFAPPTSDQPPRSADSAVTCSDSIAVHPGVA